MGSGLMFTQRRQVLRRAPPEFFSQNRRITMSLC